MYWSTIILFALLIASIVSLLITGLIGVKFDRDNKHLHPASKDYVRREESSNKTTNIILLPVVVFIIYSVIYALIVGVNYLTK